MWDYLIHGEPSPKVQGFLEGLGKALETQGFRYNPDSKAPNPFVCYLTPTPGM